PSLPGFFRKNGYKTLSVGKVTHHPGGLVGREWNEGAEELPGAWDVSVMPSGPWKTPEGAMHGYAKGRTRRAAGNDKSGKPVSEAGGAEDLDYPDAWIAEEAVSRLKELAEGEQPFFMAVGFIKPHLPFAAPASYF